MMLSERKISLTYVFDYEIHVMIEIYSDRGRETATEFGWTENATII